MIKKILVPTDFSEHARAAYAYALHFAAALEAEVEVLHVFQPSVSDGNMFAVAPGQNMEQMRRDQLDQFVALRDNTRVATTLPVRADLSMGFASDAIIKASSDYDLIIMATTGSGGLFEKVFGSVSIKVSKKASCPVLLIPSKVRFQSFKNLAYASNHESARVDALRSLKKLAAQFGAEIHLVHVSDIDQPNEASNEEELKLEKVFEQEFPDVAYRMVTINNDDVWEGLNEYAGFHNIDLIIMLSYQRSFWERLTNPSETKKMILHSERPLLILHPLGKAQA